MKQSLTRFLYLSLVITALILLTACRAASSNAPTIHNVVLSPPIPLAGQPVTITWDVTGANVVDLLPFVNSIPADQKSYTFEQGFQQATSMLFIARSVEASAQREMVIPILPTATPAATGLPTATATLPGTPTPLPTWTPLPTFTPLPPPTWTPVPVDPIIQVWSVTPLQTTAGGTVTIQWRVTQATSVIIEPFGQQPLQGVLYDQPQSSRVYNLIASNSSRSVSQSIAVSVATPPPPLPTIQQFSITPATAIRGYTQSIRIKWSTINADNVWIDPTLGSEPTSGQRDIAVPSGDTLYTLTARNFTGEVRSQMWVKVVDPSCTTLTDWSDMNPGPGTAYGPAFRDLPKGAVLTPKNYNDMGSGGKWVYVTYIKTGEKGWTQDKPGYLSCNIDITSLPAATIPFNITDVSLTPSPSSYSGLCPVTVRTTAKITATGSGQAVFRWVRSDGVQSSQQSVSFSGPGTKSVTYDWQINDSKDNYWIALSFSQPSSFTTNQTPFKVTCVQPTVMPYP